MSEITTATTDATEQIITEDSPEAASLKTVTGWVSRRGFFWGDDERMARFDGATHYRCAGCNVPILRPATRCAPCDEKAKQEAWVKAERQVWDESDMVYSDVADRYFDDVDEIRDYCEREGVTPDSLRLYICEPNYARLIDDDFFCDELASDDDLPAEVQAAVDAFNAAIKAYDTPLSWSAGDVAAVIAWPKGSEPRPEP